MTLTVSRDSLLAATVDLLWAQWTELGVGGTRGTPTSIIDPEALLAVTTVFGRYEPRLFDEVLDWLAGHSAALDVTRLRRVSDLRLLGDRRLLTTLLVFMREQSSSSKWAEAAQRGLLAGEEREPYAPQALFRTTDGGVLPTFGEHDPFFASHGFERPVLALRGLSSAPDARRPALARLRLRALMGQGVRAEVLLYLSTHDHAHGRLMADRGAYSQRQVAEYLSGLEDAGLAESWAQGRRLEYRLAPPLADVVSSGTGYVDWIGVFTLLVAAWDTLSSAALEPDSYIASTILRSGLEAVRAGLPVEGFEVTHPEPDRNPGEKVTGHALEFIGSVVDRVRTYAV
jgi:hypothetical protein